MQYAISKKASPSDLLRRSLFFFESNIAKPNMATLTYQDFVKLCVENSVTSVASTPDNSYDMVLNPATGVRSGKKFWHTRPWNLAYYFNVIANTTTGRLTSVNSIAGYRFAFDRQFSYSITDDLNVIKNNGTPDATGHFVYGVPYATEMYMSKIVRGTTTPVMSSTQGRTTTYKADLSGTDAVDVGLNLGVNGSTNDIRFSATITTTTGLKYRALWQNSYYTNGSYFYYQSSVTSGPYAVTTDADTICSPTWAMGSYYNYRGDLMLVKLDDTDVASIAPKVFSDGTGQGTASLNISLFPANPVYSLN